MKLVKITAIWCMSCIITNEQLKELEEENTIIYEAINYDYDIDKTEIEKYNVGKVLPVLILIKDEKEVGRLIGEKSTKELIKFFKDNGGIV